MDNPEISNPNDLKVVTFVNGSTIEFTPALGAMYDGRPIFGVSGESIAVGEKVVLPYHVGMLLAKNLAKAVMNIDSGADKSGVPTGVPIWNDSKLKELQSSYILEMYSEDKIAPLSETDKVMKKVDEYKQMEDKVLPEKEKDKSKTVKSDYKDKADVIAELKKRDIKFNARMSKANLEKLLV